jgi:hypothetical protein
MDSMLGAIKARRQGSQSAGMMDSGQESDMGGGEQAPGAEMQGLVAQLSPEQKTHLLELLVQEAKGSEGVDKGEASGAERAEVAAQAAEDQESEADGSELSGDESDDIAMSMVDPRAKQMAEGQGQPRNLSERAKMSMASKLKSKGKLK